MAQINKPCSPIHVPCHSQRGTAPRTRLHGLRVLRRDMDGTVNLMLRGFLFRLEFAHSLRGEGRSSEGMRDGFCQMHNYCAGNP